LELGAGAGSIAAWLANKVGPTGSVLATDLDPIHLDETKYSVMQHDLQNDPLAAETFDLAHLRHLLIHLTDPDAIVKKIRGCLKVGGYLIAEESDLRTWLPLSDQLEGNFCDGIAAVSKLYSARGLDMSIGATLASLLAKSGFAVIRQASARREVAGGSAEAVYQGLSMRLLADSVVEEYPELSAELSVFADCFSEPGLRYQSRTTVSVCAQRVG